MDDLPNFHELSFPVRKSVIINQDNEAGKNTMSKKFKYGRQFILQYIFHLLVVTVNY